MMAHQAAMWAKIDHFLFLPYTETSESKKGRIFKLNFLNLLHNNQQGSDTFQKQNYQIAWNLTIFKLLCQEESVYVQVYVNMNDIFLHKHQAYDDFFSSEKEKSK